MVFMLNYPAFTHGMEEYGLGTVDYTYKSQVQIKLDCLHLRSRSYRQAAHIRIIFSYAVP